MKSVSVLVTKKRSDSVECVTYALSTEAAKVLVGNIVHLWAAIKRFAVVPAAGPCLDGIAGRRLVVEHVGEDHSHDGDRAGQEGDRGSIKCRHGWVALEVELQIYISPMIPFTLEPLYIFFLRMIELTLGIRAVKR